MLRARSLASWALVLAMQAAWVGSEPASAQGTEAALRQEIAQGGRRAGRARYDLAQWLWRQGRYAEAAETARESLRAEPEGRFAKEARVVLCQARRDGAILLPPTEPHDFKSGSGGTVSRPELIHHVKPVYSGAARKAHVEGTVILESVIDEEGCVQAVRVRKGIHPDLDQAALDAVGQWIFLPARVEDAPVKVHYALTVNFGIDPSRKGES